MAENILGVLFVTSTSRGRNVFRYPPDPLSPFPRLNQPIFPSSTFTARDNIFGDQRRTRLFPDHANGSDGRGGRKSSAASGARRRSSQAFPGRGFGESEGARSFGRSYGERTSRATATSRSGGDQGGAWYGADEDDRSDSDATEDSEEEFEHYIGGDRGPLSGRRLEEEVIKLGQEAKRDAQKKEEKRREGQIVMETSGSRRTSLTRNGHTEGKGGKEEEKGHDSNKRGKYNEDIERQYNYALSYSLDFLSDMLNPPTSACNRQFEICVDELVFVGHPVTIGSDGWSFPPDTADLSRSSHEEPERRGRRREAVGHSHLRTVIEGHESTPNSGRGNAADLPLLTPPDMKDSKLDDDCPTLNMFHMVIILDKPDPKQVDGEHLTSPGYEEVYKEIAFKWTAAAYALQVKDNWVARESWEMAKARERFMMEGVSIEKCTQSLYQTNPLERALQDLAFCLWQFRTQPVNPLYAHLPSTLSVSLAGMPLSMTLSPRTPTYESWATWGGMEADSDASSDSDDIFPTVERGSELVVDPWKTLLLVDDDTKSKAREVAVSVVGGDWTPLGEASPQVALGSRRGSKETTAEEDESNLMKALIEACDVSKNIEDIAHHLRFDLEGIVIPLARELVQNKKAILIDPIRSGMRTLVMPTTIAEHITSIEDYTSMFADRFPTLPSLPAFVSQLSATPAPFRDVIPAESTTDPVVRQAHLDSLIWLLKHDLLIQVHTRVRIWARPEVKEKAWRRLWARRRQRWINSRAGSTRGTDSMHSSQFGELITPKAERKADPMETTVPPPQPSLDRTGTHTPAFQSYMDYDPELELDSDVGEGDSTEFKSDIERLEAMQFTNDRHEPADKEVPHFEGSFILRPARAVKEEMRWLRVIRESVDDVIASRFDLAVQYFDGQCTFEEISYRTQLKMKELAQLIDSFKDDVIVLMHP